MSEVENQNVVFFDGVCGLCNSTVDFIMRVDRKNIFKFSPLQSEYAHQNLPSEYVRDLDSIVVLVDGQKFRKARAVLRVFEKIGGPWKALAIFKFLPDGILDSSYDLVAENRYRLFGKKESCRVPSPEERARFIL